MLGLLQLALLLLVPCKSLAGAAATSGSAATATTTMAAAVTVSTLFPYEPPKKGTNPGSGCWWGPSFAVTKAGTVLVAAELKLETTQHEIPTELVMKRSLDGGRSFGATAVLVSDPTHGTVFGGGTFIHAAATDVVFYMYLGASDCNKKLDPSCNPSALPLYVIRSHDAGVSWSPPVAVATANGTNHTAGEVVGHGTELRHGAHRGRLLQTVNQWFGAGPKDGPGYILQVYSIYSDDNGATWEQGGYVPLPSIHAEAVAAELSNGSLVVSMRNAEPRTPSPGLPNDAVLCDAANVSCRVFARSDDGGSTWGEWWALPTAKLPIYTCQAAFVGSPDGKTLYIGAPMNTSTGDRWNYTVYSSSDGGREWTWFAGVYSGPAGYSDMSFLPDGNLVVSFQLGGAPKFSAGQAGTSLALAVVQLPQSHLLAPAPAPAEEG